MRTKTSMRISRHPGRPSAEREERAVGPTRRSGVKHQHAVGNGRYGDHVAGARCVGITGARDDGRDRVAVGVEQGILVRRWCTWAAESCAWAAISRAQP